jgi:hypothetical protein
MTANNKQIRSQRPIFEPGTSNLRSTNANHSTSTIGRMVSLYLRTLYAFMVRHWDTCTFNISQLFTLSSCHQTVKELYYLLSSFTCNCPVVSQPVILSTCFSWSGLNRYFGEWVSRHAVMWQVSLHLLLSSISSFISHPSIRGYLV